MNESTASTQAAPNAGQPLPQPAAIARAILEGFDRHYRLFRYVAQQAKGQYENGAWRRMQQSARSRIDFYDQRVNEAVARVRADFDLDALADDQRDAVWQSAKQHYVALLADHRQPECAETFFNSVSTKLLARDYFSNEFLFVRPGVATDYMDSDPPSYRSYYPGSGESKTGLRAALRQIIIDVGLACPFVDVERDIRRVIRAVCEAHRRQEAFARPWHAEPDCQIQVLSSLFFRNKGAYIVGRMINGTRLTPIAVPLLRDERGRIYIDTVIFTTDLLATLFSFTRAYFLVDMEAPSAYVDFLHTLLPHKPASELYTMVGLQKQGKTLFYRDFLHHLRHSTDRFVIAPGITGMVMSVFTLPSYPYVFKMIKDVIPYPKETDREQVKGKYQLVKVHDRVGRMADTWEYSQVALPRARFHPDLLRELMQMCPSQLELDASTVVLKHVYIERRMTPLNIYLQHATDAELDAAIRGYGQAIKDLAAANIFPGDMLYKNFGVTRLGRIVFYDYDEIEYMTDCKFRPIPPAPDEESEMSGEPWYKERIQRGQLEDVFPYPTERRFGHRFGDDRR